MLNFIDLDLFSEKIPSRFNDNLYGRKCEIENRYFISLNRSAEIDLDWIEVSKEKFTWILNTCEELDKIYWNDLDEFVHKGTRLIMDVYPLSYLKRIMLKEGK